MPHRPRKRFGQNFLHDPVIIRRIIAAIRPQQGDRLVEIGPGQGAITVELLRAAGRLEAVELDRDLVEPLARRCEEVGELIVHNADALRFDLCTLAHPDTGLRIVGNLPYNISTPLLFRFRAQAPCIQDMHLMLQKEVVDRIVAGHGSKTYGRLSVMIQTWCQAESLFIIRPGAFHPPPKVDSAFLRLTPMNPPQYPVSDADFHARLVARAFAQRRKTLRNALRGFLDARCLDELGIGAERRAEEIDVATFASLANLACKAAPLPRD